MLSSCCCLSKYSLFLVTDWNAHRGRFKVRFTESANRPWCRFDPRTKTRRPESPLDARRSKPRRPRCFGSGRAWRASDWTWSGFVRAGSGVLVGRDAGPCCSGWRSSGSRGRRPGCLDGVAGCEPAGSSRSRRCARRTGIAAWCLKWKKVIFF